MKRSEEKEDLIYNFSNLVDKAKVNKSLIQDFHENIVKKLLLLSINNFNKIRKNEKIRYMFPIIYENNIQVIWKKNNMDLRDFKKDKLFTYDN